MTARDITVIKCGGHTTVTPAALSADLAELTASGRPVVVVHGGSADIERLGARLNVPMRRLAAPDGVSGRYTDPATLEVVTLALAGAVRPRLVAAPPAQRAGGMGVKLTAAREALAAGVRDVLVANGRVPAPVSRALAGSATRVALATLMQGGWR